MDSEDDKIVTCRQAAWYFRQALYNAESIEDARSVALMAIDEMEQLKQQVRELGEIPDRVYDPTKLVDDSDPNQQTFELEA